MAVASVVGVTSTPRKTEYLTPDMFKFDGRRGVDVGKLVPRGQEADQDGALLQYIYAASAWCDHICQQILVATADTMLEQVNINKRGYAVIAPRYRPVIAVTAFAIGSTPSALQTFTDLSGIGVERDQFSVPANQGGIPVFSNQGPLQLGGFTSPTWQAWVQYTYHNGFPVAHLAAPIVAADTVVHLDDTTGIVNGNTWLTIYSDTGKRQVFQAGAVSTAPLGGVGTGPGTVVCPAQPFAVSNVGPYPVQVSGLPDNVIQANVLATRAFIKDFNPSLATGGEKARSSDDDLAEAAELLRDFVAPVA